MGSSSSIGACSGNSQPALASGSSTAVQPNKRDAPALLAFMGAT